MTDSRVSLSDYERPSIGTVALLSYHRDRCKLFLLKRGSNPAVLVETITEGRLYIAIGISNMAWRSILKKTD